jgi:hypothetical protein
MLRGSPDFRDYHMLWILFDAQHVAAHDEQVMYDTSVHVFERGVSQICHESKVLKYILPHECLVVWQLG